MLLRVFLAMLLCLAPLPTPAQSQGRAGVTEHDLKVAYLYHFTRYFTWPDEAFDGADAPFVIGVLGSNWLDGALDEVARRKTAGGRKIVIRRFKSWDEFSPCHILFLPGALEKEIQAQAVARTRRSSLLLVGETPGFAGRGATANFYADVDGTIGFEINVDAAAERKLRVDARLLKLARVVKSSPSS